MATTVDFAKSIERNLNDQRKLGFQMPKACLYGVDTDGLVMLCDERGDIYELLDGTDVADLLTVYSHIGVATTGWASPNDDDSDTPPSQREDRRRVRLVVIADKKSMVSVLRFSDDANHIIVDEGKAIGSLATAITEATNRTPSTKPWDFLVGDDNE